MNTEKKFFITLTLVFIFLVSAWPNTSSALTNTNSMSIPCEKKGTSGACSHQLPTASSYQAFQGNVNVHLDGHGTFGPSGGKGGLSFCLSPSNVMWTGSCWSPVSSGGNGNIGDGAADFNTTGSVAEGNTGFYWMNIEYYANDATWTGTATVTGHQDDPPPPATCGDGNVDPGEACDDGAANGICAAASCSTSCTVNNCSVFNDTTPVQVVCFPAAITVGQTTNCSGYQSGIPSSAAASDSWGAYIPPSSLGNRCNTDPSDGPQICPIAAFTYASGWGATLVGVAPGVVNVGCYAGVPCNPAGLTVVPAPPPPVPPPPPPSADIQGRPASSGSYTDGPVNININSSADLSWTSTNALTCTASGDWSGAKATSGTSNTGSLSVGRTYSYIIDCGGAVDTLTVVASSTPSVDLQVRPSGSGSYSDGPITIAAGAAAQLSWTSANAASCTASGSWSGSQSTSGNNVGTGNLAAGNYTYSIDCGGATDSVTVNSQAPFSYTLSNSGTSNVAKTSGTANVANTITKTLSSGTAQAVSLSVAGVPANVAFSISNQNCNPTCSSTITFNVASNATPGTYLITVTGSPNNATTNFNLVITGNPMTVTCSANPTVALLGQIVTWTANVSSGGTGPFTYSWTGTNVPTSPAPNTSSFNITYGTIGNKMANVTVTDADGLNANCSTVPTVRVNFQPVIEEF